MKRTIGVVAEGPRDFDVITAVIDNITGEENEYQHLQPEPNANGEFGNGWKGVWKWCESHREYLSDYFYSVTPHLDLLVIHMDADVWQNEKPQAGVKTKMLPACQCEERKRKSRSDDLSKLCYNIRAGEKGGECLCFNRILVS